MLIAINDPRRLTEDDFLAGFVARTETADFLIDQLRQMTSSGEGRHRLIVGQRGMGKTSLLRRIAIGVTRDGDLAARYVPLTFREEQYNVRSVDQFLRNCGEALAEWLEQSGNDKSAREIDQSLRTEKWRNPAGACETFHLLISALGLRPLLLVDNLDLIFDAMPSEQHWQLRRMLQNRGGPVLYGASTQIPQQFSDREEAFYEFFQIHPLEPLSQSELIRCLYRLTEARGESGRSVKDLLDREPERLRVLHTLTGGNPRVLVLIYQLLERAENQAVFADLEALLDQMTPFYKSRIEELKSDLQRAILDAIALNWDPITSHEISKITGVELTTVSPQLQRLRNQGLVEEVPTSGSRSGYQIIERFLNIWYLMRHGTRRARHRMRWLAAFLKSFYSIDQLRHLRETLCANPEGGPWQPIYDVAIAEALEKVNRELEHGGRELVPQTDRSSLEMEKAEADLRSAIASKPNSTTAWIKLGDFLAKETTRFEEAESAYRRALEINGNDAAPWHRLGRLLRTRLRKYDAAETAYRRSLEIDPRRASGWVGLAYLFAVHLKRLDEAEAASRHAIDLDPNLASAWHALGCALEQQSERLEEAEAAYRRAVELDPKFVGAWFDLGNLLMHRIRRYDEAEMVYRQAIKLNPESALLADGLGHVLGAHLDRHDEAEKVYRDAIDRNPDIALLWHGLGNFLGRNLERHKEAEECLRRAIDIDATYAPAWDDLGDLLYHLKRYDEAETAYRRTLEISPSAIHVLRSLASLLHRPGKFDEAERICRRLIKIDPNSADAWIELGNLLGFHLGRYEEAEAAYRRALEIEPKSSRAWGCFGSLLSSQNGNETKAEAALQRAIELKPDYAYAWRVLSILLENQLGRSEEAEKAFRRVAEIDEKKSLPWINLARFLCERSKYDEAEAAYRRAIEIDPNQPSSWDALGNLLQDHFTARLDEAEEAYTREIEVGGRDTSVAKSNLFWLHVKLGKITQAAELRRELSTDPVGLKLADAALEIARDNFGAMSELLNAALSDNALSPAYFDDLLRLLRLVERRGFGTRLIAWFKDAGHDLTNAPIYAAFVAFVKGPRALLDFNPEVRQPARVIYSWLTSQGGAPQQGMTEKPPPRRRGPRKRRL